MIVVLDLSAVPVMTWTIAAVYIIEATAPVTPLNDNLLIAIMVPAVRGAIVPSFCLPDWEHTAQR